MPLRRRRTGEKKEMGSLFRERKRHCRVHPCAHNGKTSWRAFAKTEEAGEVSA